MFGGDITNKALLSKLEYRGHQAGRQTVGGETGTSKLCVSTTFKEGAEHAKMVHAKMALQFQAILFIKREPPSLPTLALVHAVTLPKERDLRKMSAHA